MRRIIAALFLFFVFAASSMAQSKNVRLFYIERSGYPNNFVSYDVNLKNGVPVVKKPLDVYWCGVKDPERHDELTILDKTAFGYSAKSLGGNEYSFTLRASSKKLFKLCQYKGKWMAIAKINGTDSQVLKLYVKTKSIMGAEYVDLYGRGLSTGQQVRERIME